MPLQPSILPEEVKEMFRMEFQGPERGGRHVDQYGVEWRDVRGRHWSEQAMASAGVIAGMATALGTEKTMWPAFTRSALDPLVVHPAYKRGPHENPAARIAQTRDFFKAAILGVFGEYTPWLQRQVARVRKQHIGVGVSDKVTGDVLPDYWRSFTFVTALVVDQMDKKFAEHTLSSRFRSALPKLWYGAQQQLGMPYAPVSTPHFLAVHRRIIQQARETMRQSFPEVLQRLDAFMRLGVSRTRDVFCKNQGMSVATFNGHFDAYERRELGLEEAEDVKT